MSERTLVFVNRRADARPPARSTDVVILDTSWTPGPGERSDLIPVRAAVSAVLDRVNVIDESLERLDAWATAAALADRFMVDGVSWWVRIRMAVRWDVHELVLWRRVLDLLAPPGRYTKIVVPADRHALAAAARAGGPSPSPRVITVGDPPAVTRFLLWVGRGLRRRASRLRRDLMAMLAGRQGLRYRVATLDARAERLAARRPLVLAIAWAGAFQVVEEDGRRRRVDPHLSLVLDRLEAEGCPVATVGTGLDPRRDPDWALIERDDHLLPDAMLRTRWALAEDGATPPAMVATLLAGSTHTPLEIAGFDMAPAVQDLVEGYGGEWLDDQRRRTRRAERLMRELRPVVLFIDREGTKTPWMAAARRLGIPIVAVQHGMIYRNNPEYCYPRHPGALRPDTTCVFGSDERDVLLELAGYEPASVVVTGSPRADPDAALVPASPDERAVVRRELGVANGDRLLMVSVAHNPVLGDLHSVTTVARLLDGPLPGIHVVIKLHPQDRTDGGYADLFRGLSLAGGYALSRVTVVRDFDLYRLLRASDAHLGQYSTVLTDAVVAGTPNMIAVGQAYADPLGYAAAGVAVPARSIEDVRSFMANPQPPAPEDRARFLDAHFRRGDSVGRIADVLRAAITRKDAAARP